jgi:hypothetical protein
LEVNFWFLLRKNKKTAAAFDAAADILCSVFLFKIDNCLTVAIQTLSFDRFDAVKTCIGNEPERLSCVNIGDVDFYSGDRNSF